MNVTTKTIVSAERVTAHMCMQKDVGVNGNLFGGNIMAWVDEACAIYALEKTNEKFVVTMRFGEMVFHRPVRERDVVVFWCGDDHRGKHSITFKVEASVDGESVFATDCTFVAVDENGNKKEIAWGE